MTEHESTPLSNIIGWQKDLIEKLAECWITDAEQVIGISASPDSIQALAQQLDIPIEEMHHLINLTRASLSQSVARELEMVVDTRQFGLGALPPTTLPKPK